MAVGAVPASGFFADAASLASGFEGAALGDAEIPNIFYILTSSGDETSLLHTTALSSLLPAYRQAAAEGDRDRMQQLGSLIALNIHEHASAFDRLLATSPPSGGKRFGSLAEALAALKPHGTEASTTTTPAEKAAEISATMPLMGAEEYLRGLKADEGSEPVNFSVLHHSLLDDLAEIAGLMFLAGGVFEFLLLKGLIKISPPSTTDIAGLLAISTISFGFSGYRFLTLRKPRQYARFNPPALYDRKTGEVTAPTLARFAEQGAVPLYPVDKREDLYNLPVGSHVLLKDVPIRNVTIDKDDFHISCWLDFSGKNDGVGRFAYYHPKSMEEAVAIAEALKQENVTFVGTIIEDKRFRREVGIIRDIEIVSIDPRLPH